MSEIHDQGGDEDGEQVRPVECWLSQDVVTVHVGLDPVGMLLAPEADRGVSAIRAWGSATRTLTADGDLHGDSQETAWLRLWFPAPTV